MPEPRYRKGDRVQFRLGLRTVQGVVKEDRGPIGIKGRHLYLIDFGNGAPDEGPSQVELPAEEILLVQDAVTTD